MKKRGREGVNQGEIHLALLYLKPQSNCYLIVLRFVCEKVDEVMVLIYGPSRSFI